MNMCVLLTEVSNTDLMNLLLMCIETRTQIYLAVAFSTMCLE